MSLFDGQPLEDEDIVFVCEECQRGNHEGCCDCACECVVCNLADEDFEDEDDSAIDEAELDT